jgi:hypothetical protein
MSSTSGSEDEDLKRAIALSLQQDEEPMKLVGTVSSKKEATRFSNRELMIKLDKLDDEQRTDFAVWLSEQTESIDRIGHFRNWLSVRKPDVELNQKAVVEITSDNEDGFTQPRTISKPTENHSLKRSASQSPVVDSKRKRVENHALPSKGSQPHDLPFSKGIVKKTWASGYPRLDDIKIEEILQKQELESVIMCAWQWDIAWLQTKFDWDTVQCLFIMQDSFLEPGTTRKSGLNEIVSPSKTNNNMHSKFMVLFYKSSLRLAITSANMVPYDWGEQGGVMENVVFLIDLPMISNEMRTNQECWTNFAEDFYKYCKLLNVTPSFLQKLKGYDWTATKDKIFICSSGARVQNEDLQQMGLTGLGAKIKKAGLAYDGELQIDYVTSSVGHLNDSFLVSLYQACQGDSGLVDISKRMLSTNVEKIRKNIRIYFPSHHTVRESRGTIASGGTLYFPKAAWYADKFPKDIVYDCKSERKGCLMHNKANNIISVSVLFSNRARLCTYSQKMSISIQRTVLGHT